MPYINHCYQFNLALSQGPYAWPGGYPLYFLCADGEPLSFEAAIEMQAEIRDAIISKNPHDGWCVVGIDTNWEDAQLFCAHTGKRIPSAYAEPEDEPKPWVAGWNMPGYMPDNEPEAFATFDEAKRYIIGELKRVEDYEEDEDIATELCHCAENVNLEPGEFGVTIAGYHYFVTKA